MERHDTVGLKIFKSFGRDENVSATNWAQDNPPGHTPPLDFSPSHCCNTQTSPLHCRVTCRRILPEGNVLGFKNRQGNVLGFKNRQGNVWGRGLTQQRVKQWDRFVVPQNTRFLSSYYQIPRLFQTFQVNIYGVSAFATVVIQNEMHVISHCNTHIYCHN